jgi:hypothetical protein
MQVISRESSQPRAVLTRYPVRIEGEAVWVEVEE